MVHEHESDEDGKGAFFSLREAGEYDSSGDMSAMVLTMKTKRNLNLTIRKTGSRSTVKFCIAIWEMV